MILLNLCMDGKGVCCDGWIFSFSYIYKAIVTQGRVFLFLERVCLAGWWQGGLDETVGDDDAGVVVVLLLCIVAFLVIINDWPVEVWGDRRLSPAAAVGTADGLKGLTSGPVCCCCCCSSCCLLLIPSSITALTTLERWWDEPIDEAVHTTVTCCPLPKCSRVNLLMCNPTVVDASNTIVVVTADAELLIILSVASAMDCSGRLFSTVEERQRVG